MSERADRPAPSVLAVAGMGTAGEALLAAAAAMMPSDIPVWVLLGVHVSIVAALAGFAWWQWSRTGNATGAALLALTTAGAGPFGAAGMLAALLADRGRADTTASDAQESGIVPALLHPSQLHETITAGREMPAPPAGLASFRDVLSLGTFEEKQVALMLITRRFNPAFAPALRMALRDPDASMRVQAATAAARIEDLFLAGQAEHSAHVAQHPNDPNAHLALARHLESHADAGLCTPERAQADLQQAMIHLRRAVALAPLRRDVRTAIARVLLYLGEAEEAAAHLASLEEPLSVAEAALYGEALYRVRRWDELRRLLAALRQQGNLPLSLVRIGPLWAGSPRSV
jgi:tetratricopeptide (TPR) repeat protein